MLLSCQEQPDKNVYIPPLIHNPIENDFHINHGVNKLTKRKSDRIIRLKPKNSLYILSIDMLRYCN